MNLNHDCSGNWSASRDTVIAARIAHVLGSKELVVQAVESGDVRRMAEVLNRGDVLLTAQPGVLGNPAFEWRAYQGGAVMAMVQDLVRKVREHNGQAPDPGSPAGPS